MFASDRPSWQNPRVLSTLLLIFLAGGLMGALTMREWHRRIHQTLIFQASGTNQLSYDQLKRELNLTPQQSDQLRSILDDFVRYNQDVEAQIEDVRATGKNRIRSILTPDQKGEFEKLCNGMQTR